jgi:beta-phosphoglucomutase-like phosphatase (HAD superfamily)
MIEHRLFDGYLFDLDGVLIDSMQHHREAFRVALGRYNLSLGDIEIGGRSTREVIEEVRVKNQSIEVPILELVQL